VKHLFTLRNWNNNFLIPVFIPKNAPKSHDINRNPSSMYQNFGTKKLRNGFLYHISLQIAPTKEIFAENFGIKKVLLLFLYQILP